MENALLEFITKYITLTAEEKSTITSLKVFHTLKKGSFLLKEGQYSDESYFVLNGCLRSFYVIGGEEKTTAFYSEMEGFTPNCVLTKQPSDVLFHVLKIPSWAFPIRIWKLHCLKNFQNLKVCVVFF